MALTVIVPYYLGAQFLPRLLDSLPSGLPVVVVDDHSPEPVPDLARWPNVRAVRTREHGYFAGAVNRGFEEAPLDHDVLILNQDVWFSGGGWLDALGKALKAHGLTGDFVTSNKRYPQGYVQGTFMGVRADVRAKLGDFDADLYPHWGVTCLYQMRACRAGFTAAPLPGLHKWMQHARDEQRGQRHYGSATAAVLDGAASALKRRLIATPVRLSIIMPCHNKAPWIDEAVQSLIASSFQNWELIIVDDASTDNSRERIERWVSPGAHIKAIYLPENKGVVVARNTGVAAAVGPLIFQLDADDMVHPDGLRRMVAAFDANPVRWVYSDMHIFGEGIKEHTRVFKDFDDPHPYDCAINNRAPSFILYPRKWWAQVGGYVPESVRGHDDWAFGLALTAAGHCGQRLQSIDGDARPAVFYRKTPNSRNKTSRARAHELMQVRRELFPQIYAGLKQRIDPMACCGNRGRRAKPRGARPLTPLADAGEIKYVEYVGRATAPFPMRGAATRTRYNVVPGKLLQIYEADERYIVARRDFQKVAPPPAPIEADPSAGVVAEPSVEETLLLEDPGDMTVSEAAKYARTLDADALAVFYEAEVEGKQRVTLFNALEGLMNKGPELV